MTIYIWEDDGASFLPLPKKEGVRLKKTEKIEKEWNYLVSEKYKNYNLAVTYPLKKANVSVPGTTALLGLALMAALIIINIVIAQAFKAQEKSKSELQDTNNILETAGFGIWYIRLMEGKKPRMYANPKMKEVLGIEGQFLSEEEVYDFCIPVSRRKQYNLCRTVCRKCWMEMFQKILINGSIRIRA